MGEPRMTLAALLSRREAQVLRGMAEGLSHREIALRLLIFESAVREHIRSARKKLRVHAGIRAAACEGRRADELAGTERGERAS